MLGIHLVAKLRSNRIDLRRPETAPVLWNALRSRFPDALLNELMPDHTHLLIPEDDADDARARLANACGRVQYSLGWPAGSWEPVPEPRIITKQSEARRHYRYIALNEPRAGLARDPLEALWSTYREVFGAVVDPWIDPEAVLRWLGAPRRDPLEWLHGFVSGDPTVAVAGTPLPRVPAFGSIATLPLAEVIRAAAAALRLSPDAVRQIGEARRLFVGLADHVGWYRPSLLADVCGVSTRTIRRLVAEADPRSIAAAAQCLADPRLLLRTPPISCFATEKRTTNRR